jgi:large subunit ribosomal protein L23
MRDPQGIIVRPLMTEKNMDRVQKRSVYSFEVVGDANKVEIRSAVEKLFNVKVTERPHTR